METLYHYCSAKTFTSILNKNSIWLSSLSLSNDYMEGKLVSSTFENLLTQSNIDSEEMDAIRRAIIMSEEMFDGLGFCLSEVPDLLSQWRGYADDGQGFSIGFSRNYLDALSKIKTEGASGFRLHQVKYEPEEHETALRPIYNKIKSLVDSGKLKMPKFGILTRLDEQDIDMKKNEYLESIKKLWLEALSAFPNVYILKNKAFKEEAEWRLISYFAREFDDLANFRASENRIIPYREFKLKELDQKRINEVYIGPKNITPNHVVERFLKLSGFIDVTIHRSSATYR